MTGVVYTETVVHSSAPAFAADVPYQVAIVLTADGGRVTARIQGPRVTIGDRVARDGDAFRKIE
ncbi:MAG: Zn-ribbon domain-containing OB-fold protein [Bryobacteraceae bacterium]